MEHSDVQDDAYGVMPPPPEVYFSALGQPQPFDLAATRFFTGYNQDLPINFLNHWVSPSVFHSPCLTFQSLNGNVQPNVDAAATWPGILPHIRPQLTLPPLNTPFD